MGSWRFRSSEVGTSSERKSDRSSYIVRSATSSVPDSLGEKSGCTTRTAGLHVPSSGPLQTPGVPTLVSSPSPFPAPCEHPPAGVCSQPQMCSLPQVCSAPGVLPALHTLSASGVLPLTTAQVLTCPWAFEHGVPLPGMPTPLQPIVTPVLGPSISPYLLQEALCLPCG